MFVVELITFFSIIAESLMFSVAALHHNLLRIDASSEI
jgi:hypothetical protein